jgi:hypothetical protein
MNWKKLARLMGMFAVLGIMGTIDIVAILESPALDTAKELGQKWGIILGVIITFYYKLESEKDV